MRWNFGGNLQPVRTICEYDWKECPIAFVSYVWSEIVTDVIESITGDAQFWRILAVMLLCSMLFHTAYYKMRWVNTSEHDFAKDHLIKVGFKMQDLELKINILTYKMQYGTWPLPHEIPTPSLNELRNIKLTLSNTSRQNMWTKHHLHGYISKYIQNSEDNKSMNKLLATNEELDLAHKNFLSQFKNRNNDFETLKSERNLKLLQRENNCKDYEKLLETAEECRRYMDEINESNKSLGLFENSSDISDQNSVRDISAGNESEQNSHRFLIDPKKWHEIYKYKNKENEEASESDLTTSNQMFSMSNLKHKDLMFSDDDERYPLKNSNRSRLLPPGLSITFLSDKFKTFPSRDKCISAESTRQSRNKTSTNETLNKVKEKLESLHDIKHAMKNSKSLSNVEERLENKKSREISLSIKTSSKINSSKYEEKQRSNIKKLDKLISSECDSSSGDNGMALNQLQREVIPKKIPAKTQITIDCNVYPENAPNINLNNAETSVQNPSNVSNEINKNLIVFPMEKSSTHCSVVKSLSKISQRKKNLTSESDSITSFGINSTSTPKPFNWNENVVRSTGSIINDKRNLENNINMNSTNESISKTSMNFVLSSIPMETDEDVTVISRTSSQTELSKDSDTDDKSTTTLLREALEFKKALLIQIHKETEMGQEKNAINESSECDSDDTSRSKTDNHFRSKLLDIISEEQSAGSSTEKTSRTYILSRAINETNLCEDPDQYFGHNKAEDIKCNEVMLDGECCGDSKSVVTASSSEYFSINNITDNEHTSAQKVNQCVADGDGVKELQKSCLRKMQEGELEFYITNNRENNNIAHSFDEELKKYDAKKENDLVEGKSSDVPSKKLQAVMKKETANVGKNYTQSQPESSESCVENSRKLNKLEKFVRNEADIDKIEASIGDECENSLGKIEEDIDSVQEKITKKGESKIKFFGSLSSIDSERRISWNSISESSSNESMAKFVNTLENVELKNIDTIAEQKLMMLNSTDYDGRNFATAGEDLRYSFNLHNRTQPSFVSLSDINISKQSNAIIEEILEMIEDCAIFKSHKSETKEQNISTDKASTDHSEGSNLFNSHNVLQLGQEKLQRKQDIFSKLKSLDAFTKPFDIMDCNSEKNENEEDASPLTGRTVVCICNSNATNIAESFSKAESDILTDKSSNLILKNNETTARIENFVADKCETVKANKISDVSANENKLTEAKSQQLVSGSELNESGETKNNTNTIDTSQSSFTVRRISSMHYLIPVINIEKEENQVDAKSNWESSADQSCNNFKCDTKSDSKKIIQNSKRNQLSKSSITNFSTDTSESYFDVSNHDFAVSSIILTSQNSNFASNCREDSARSDTSSSYVDASDHCSKISSNSSSTEGTATSNLSAKKNYFSELQIANVNTDETEKIKTADTGITIKDIAAQNNLNSEHESSIKTQLIPKCTTSLPSGDKKSQLETQGQVAMKEQSSSSLNEDTKKYCSSLNLEKSYSKGRSVSRSCIPILKSKIETPRREKSMEAKTRSRSPVRRSNTWTIQDTESNCQIGEASSINENEKRTRQSSYGSKKSLGKKQSYTLPSKNSDIKQECLNEKPDSLENKECKIVRCVSNDLAVTAEKSDLLDTSGKLTKECTVIYINIISDSDRNESQIIDANELIKYVNERDLIFCDKKVDPKGQSLSLRNIKFDRSDKRKNEMNVASPTSDSKLCLNLSDGLKKGNEEAVTMTRTSLEAERKDSTDANDPDRILPPFGTTANKLLSTSTLQLSISDKIERREIEILAKPSVKNISTSVSDFPDTSPEGKRSFYNAKNEVFDVSNDLLQKEQIVMSEMLTTEQNFFECKKSHRLYNKLGLGIQEQTEEL